MDAPYRKHSVVAKAKGCRLRSGGRMKKESNRGRGRYRYRDRGNRVNRINRVNRGRIGGVPIRRASRRGRGGVFDLATGVGRVSML